MAPNGAFPQQSGGPNLMDPCPLATSWVFPEP